MEKRKNNKPITFHYTKPEMVEYLISKTPIKGSVLDAGSGKNKVWFNALKGEKYECELEDGNDFFEWSKKVDWIVGNPPYHESWKFTEKALTIANKGIAWLLNNQALNSHFTPRRLSRMSELGWHYSKIIVVADKRWFGRYYYLILEKKFNNFIETNTKTF